ncbi:MAG: hypothetical protein HYU39_00710 [Thaumarchaeota archaeon]|nr:hypothetical protein [Nitrososphaerota archaeon]
MAEKAAKHTVTIGVALLAVIGSSVIGLGYYQYVFLPSAGGGEGGIPENVLNPSQNATIRLIAGSYFPSQADNYTPKNLTVTLGVNNKVVWAMEDTVPHTVTSVGKTADSKFDEAANSGNYLRQLGDRFVFTFTKQGVYNYYCVPHAAWMRGVVTVLPGSEQSGQQSSEHK